MKYYERLVSRLPEIVVVRRAATIIDLIVGLILLLLLLSVSLPANAAEITGKNVFDLVNQQRVSHHLSPLVPNFALVKSAQVKARDLVSKSYFSHRQPITRNGPEYFLDASGYKYTEAGENLAKGFSTAEEVVDAWMKSPTHRKVILYGPYVDSGIGISKSGDEIFVVQYFGNKIK